MKTFSKGRKTPINDYSDLSYAKPGKSYKRQHRDMILAARSFVELDDDLILNQQEDRIQYLLYVSNCPTTGDLFTLLIYEFYKQNLKKLSFIKRIAWHYQRDFKSIARRLKSDNDFGLDYVLLQNNYIQNKRFAIRKENLLSSFEFDDSDSTTYINEEEWLQFDALQLAQHVIKEESFRPSCVSELLKILIDEKFYLVKTLEIESAQEITPKSVGLDYAPFLIKYARLINVNTDEKRSRAEFIRYQKFLTLDNIQRKSYSLKRVIPRFLETIL